MMDPVWYGEPYLSEFQTLTGLNSTSTDALYDETTTGTFGSDFV